MRIRFGVMVALSAGLGAVPATVRAQHEQHGQAGTAVRAWHWGAQAIGLVTHATPAEGGRSLTEGYLTQPNLMVDGVLWGERLGFTGTVNLEGWTLRRGELNAGTWGEGYVDRRHPHTFLHVAVLTFNGHAVGAAFSVSAGKGFIPFGTDDPMVRPFVKFPANHHLAQVLERLIVIGAIQRGMVLVEGAAFNGDEPLDPGHLGSLDRLGDSWAARVTVMPVSGSEFQVSHARLESPEEPHGAGLDQRKWSVSARYERGDRANGAYLLGEWLRTSEIRRGEEVIVLPSVLAEAAIRRNGWQVAARVERTKRPEEERSDGIFRSPWPHVDLFPLGYTRWDIVSLSVTREWGVRGVRLAPLLEVGHQHPRPERRPTLFAPESLYGSDRLWSLSAGVRIGAGMRHDRMGRHGAAANVH